MLLVGIFLSYILVTEDHRIFAQLGIPADSILLNNTNTTQMAPTITGNTTVTPALEVNEKFNWEVNPDNFKHNFTNR
jgi:hypothetical protein